MRQEVASERQVTRDAQESTEEAGSFAFAHRVLIATCVVAGVALVLVCVWYAADVLLLVFAGILASILLRGFSQFLTRKTGVGHGLSLALISLTLLTLIVAGVWLIGGQRRRADQRAPTAIATSRREPAPAYRAIRLEAQCDCEPAEHARMVHESQRHHMRAVHRSCHSEPFAGLRIPSMKGPRILMLRSARLVSTPPASPALDTRRS
jgi:hypothetical protein